MKEKRDCKLVLDLLPNYIEKLTNEETNNFIEEHLKTCEECKSIFESMKRDLKVDTEKVNTKGIKIFKKYNRELKLFRNLLLLVIAIYVAIFVYKFVALTDIYNKTSNQQIGENHDIREYSNFYSRMESLSQGFLNISESYVKDGKYVSSFVRYNIKDMTQVASIIQYEDENGRMTIFEPVKYASVYKKTEKELGIHYITASPKSIGERICLALTSSIHTTTIGNKKCYVIKFR